VEIKIPDSLFNYIISLTDSEYYPSHRDEVNFRGYSGIIKLIKVEESEFESSNKELNIISETITGGYKYCLTKEITNEQVTRSEGNKRKRTSKERNPEGIESGASRSIQRKA